MSVMMLLLLAHADIKSYIGDEYDGGGSIIVVSFTMSSFFNCILTWLIFCQQ